MIQKLISVRIGILLWMLGFLLGSSLLAAKGVETLQLSPAEGMSLAEVSFIKTGATPRAVLVLCPGCNGDGKSFLKEKQWLDFAKKEKLGIIALHFRSPYDLLCHCQGYYQASQGSGKLLLQAIHQIYGKDLPIVIYGFSGGAHFTARFIAWAPERILAWCAQGAGVLDAPVAAPISPPGVMACGESDPRLGGALTFFKQGRGKEKPWLWVELKGLGHATSPEMEKFVRHYFEAVLNDSGQDKGCWVDIDLKTMVSSEEALNMPSLSGWLPSKELFKEWKTIHEE